MDIILFVYWACGLEWRLVTRGRHAKLSGILSLCSRFHEKPMGLWSSGYDIALTWRGSPVRVET